MGTEVHGIAMVKDEADVIRTTVEWMLSQVDQVHVADNESTDGTQQILNRLAENNDRLHISIDIEVGYYQSRKMTLLAEHAGRHGAAWVVPFDADEIWYSLYHERIADALDQCVDLAVVEADMYEHVPTPLATHGVMPGIAAMPWRIATSKGQPKVACRTSLPVTIAQGNHGASYIQPTAAQGLLSIRHFPYRTPEQFIRKVRNGAVAYAAAPDLPSGFGSHWRFWGRRTDAELESIFETMVWTGPHMQDQLVYDPAPCYDRVQ